MKKWTLLENSAKILALHASAHAAMNEILEELYLSAAKPSSLGGSTDYGRRTGNNYQPEEGGREGIPTDTVLLHQTSASPKEVSQEEGDRDQYQ